MKNARQKKMKIRKVVRIDGNGKRTVFRKGKSSKEVVNLALRIASKTDLRLRVLPETKTFVEARLKLYKKVINDLLAELHMDETDRAFGQIAYRALVMLYNRQHRHLKPLTISQFVRPDFRGFPFSRNGY